MSRMMLDVGGEMLKTTKETLTKFPNSRLAKMVNSTKSEDVLWLDLDPDYFRPILKCADPPAILSAPHCFVASTSHFSIGIPSTYF